MVLRSGCGYSCNKGAKAIISVAAVDFLQCGIWNSWFFCLLCYRCYCFGGFMRLLYVHRRRRICLALRRCVCDDGLGTSSGAS